MKTEFKERLISKFLEYPLLHMLLRLLLFTFWFRVVFLLFVAVVLAFALGLGKIWKTTPSGFMPEIKVSGLDFFQAWMLHRAALKHLESGDEEEAIFSFRVAIANNLANADTIRSFFKEMKEADLKRPYAPHPGLATWLLRLSNTNRMDLELVAPALDFHGLHANFLELVAPFKMDLNPSQQVIYMKSLFETGRFLDFSQYWKEEADRDFAMKDPEFALYRSAFLDGWGSILEYEAPPLRLEDYLEDPKYRLVANRLFLKVCAQRAEVEKYWDTVARLESWYEDRIRDHTQGWILLDEFGQSTEAIAKANAFARPPQTSMDIYYLTSAYKKLGLSELAIAALKTEIEREDVPVIACFLYFDLLVESERWEDLKAVALLVRLNPGVRDRLSGYSLFIEGWADWHLGRTTAASRSFEKASARGIQGLNYAVSAAQALNSIQQAIHARALLAPFEASANDNPQFQRLLVEISSNLKDGKLLLSAASRLYELKPTDFYSLNLYAAALLTNRTDPSIAVQHSFRIMGALPNSVMSRINHSLALVQNRRYDEAEELLRTVPNDQLNGAERTYYFLALHEMAAVQGDLENAESLYARIEQQHLFDSELDYLEGLRSKYLASLK